MTAAKEWIGNLKKGDLVLVGMGPWTPDLTAGIVLEVDATPDFCVKVQLGDLLLSFDCLGNEISPWPTMDGPYLDRPFYMN